MAYGMDYFPTAPLNNRTMGIMEGSFGSNWNQSPGGAGGGGLGGFGGGGGFGFNMPTFQLGLQGLGMGLNFYNAMQANKLAKQQFNFQKEFAMKNLANQTKTYNTALEDRGRARAAMEGQSAEEAAAYIDNNRL